MADSFSEDAKSHAAKTYGGGQRDEKNEKAGCFQKPPETR